VIQDGETDVIIHECLPISRREPNRKPTFILLSQAFLILDETSHANRKVIQNPARHSVNSSSVFTRALRTRRIASLEFASREILI
jgi:hypothetical protein